MHVEISVALHFVISYLYNKLPRRRVDLFGEELEAGLKAKFEGHWYPETPRKGSGFRCVKANGDEMDPVIVTAAANAGLDLEEVKNYLPDDLTLWIDPSEVSYKLGERGVVKVLYTDTQEVETSEKADREVQAASRTFNPEAQAFTPERCQTQSAFNPDAASFTPDSATFTPDVLAFTADVQAFCSDPAQSFQPIDSLSSSLTNLSLSPSSPVPSSTWSTTTSPSSSLFSSAHPSSSPAPVAPAPGFLAPRGPPVSRQQFTAATFAQTKFGSTKLKSQAKRPNRLSPTEMGNYFRQQQRGYAGPQRPRSLSPRDPRVEFLIDQQQRLMFQQQQQQQQQQQMSPSMPYGPQYHQAGLHHLQNAQQQQQQQQQHHPHHPAGGFYPDFLRQHSSGLSSTQSSPHLSPHLSPSMSPQTPSQAFHDLLHPANPLPSPPSAGPVRPTSLSHSALHNHISTKGGRSFPSQGSFSPHASVSSPQILGSISPESPKPFVDGLGLSSSTYSGSLQHLLMAN